MNLYIECETPSIPYNNGAIIRSLGSLKSARITCNLHFKARFSNIELCSVTSLWKQVLSCTRSRRDGSVVNRTTSWIYLSVRFCVEFTNDNDCCVVELRPPSATVEILLWTYEVADYFNRNTIWVWFANMSNSYRIAFLVAGFDNGQCNISQTR